MLEDLKVWIRGIDKKLNAITEHDTHDLSSMHAIIDDFQEFISMYKTTLGQAKCNFDNQDELAELLIIYLEITVGCEAIQRKAKKIIDNNVLMFNKMRAQKDAAFNKATVALEFKFKVMLEVFEMEITDAINNFHARIKHVSKECFSWMLEYAIKSEKPEKAAFIFGLVGNHFEMLSKILNAKDAFGNTPAEYVENIKNLDVKMSIKKQLHEALQKLTAMQVVDRTASQLRGLRVWKREGMVAVSLTAERRGFGV